MDASDLNSRTDDDDDDDDGSGSPKDVKECDAQKKTTLAKNRPSVLLSISKPLSSVSEVTSPTPSSGAADGPSSSKLEKATALARAALRNRLDELGVKSGASQTTPLRMLFGYTTNSSNPKEEEVKEPKLPSNSLDNITRPLTCPGCQMDFKSFSGFVLHIENRSCMSSMCHEIENQLDACVTQLFNILTESGKA